MIRSRLYKNSGKDNEELRRRRIDQSVELRKAKKDQQLQKRRNVLRDVQETSQVESYDLKSAPANYDQIIFEMESPNTLVRLNATRMCRKLLSRAKNPPIDEFFERGAVKVLVRALDFDPSSNELVFEAAWALTNIASGESHHTQGVVESGAAPKLIHLLNHEDVRVAEQCIWALGNIAGDGCSYRDMLIKLGAVPPALQLLERAWDSAGVVSNIAWMLSNLCRNKNPNPPRQTILSLLPVFKRLLEYPLSQEVIVDTAWALSYASDCAGEFIDDILQSGCIPVLVRLLGSNSPNLVSPALRAVGNLILGDDEQTQVVVDSGVLQYAQGLLDFDRPSVVKEACWMLSNITAGNLTQIQAVVDANLVPRIIKLVEEAEFKIQKEACWVISNIVNGGSPEQRAYLLNNGALEALSKLLNVSDARVLKLVLETIKKMFETAKQFGQLEPCCLALELCGGLNSIEQLQDHTNDEVYRIAYDFIAQFFSDTDEAAGTEAANCELNQTGNTVVPARDSNEFHFHPQQNNPGGANFEF